MNVATALKSEITRVSRKEVRTELQAVKKTTLKLRADNVDLKRRVVELERLVKQLSRGQGRVAKGSVDPEITTKIRFSANGFAALRKRLGLSSAQMGSLIGVSDQSVYKYEKGEVQPRFATVAAIASLRGMRKKAVAEKLVEVGFDGS